MMYDDVTLCMMTVGVMAKLLPKIPASWPAPGGIYCVTLIDVRCHLFAHVLTCNAGTDEIRLS